MFKKNKLIEDLIKLNIKPILVGGIVRDYLMNPNLESKDIDIEMYTTKNYEDILIDLEKLGYKCDIVGKQFGVIKVKDENDNDFNDIHFTNGIGLHLTSKACSLYVDLSLPRVEKSIGNKHGDFEITTNGELSYKEAFKRRDFTFNAIGYDFIENKLIDLYNGVNDLNNKIIKHVNAKTFIEDPLRIYRAIQFAARFEFEIHPRTKVLIKDMISLGMLDNIPKERIYVEFEKLLTKSKNPSIGFELMREFNILDKYFPELNNLINVPQDPKWHPEGDVWIHTMMVIDEMAKLEVDKDKKLLYLLSCLCHDLGKLSTTITLEDGKITSRGHEEAGIEPTISFLNRLTNNKKLIEQVCKLVELHLAPSLFFAAKSSNSAIKRLNNKLVEVELSILDLALINKADTFGRTTIEALNKEAPQYEWIVNKFNDLKLSNKKIEPLIKGIDLINLGYKPNKEFKEILNSCYDYQIDNNVEKKEDVIAYLNQILESKFNFTSY